MKLDSYHYIAIGALGVALLWLVYEFWPFGKKEKQTSSVDPGLQKSIDELIRAHAALLAMKGRPYTDPDADYAQQVYKDTVAKLIEHAKGILRE